MSEETRQPPSRHLRVSDIRGLSKLAVQSVSGVTQIVEGVHLAVLKTIGVPTGTQAQKTRGITGLTYSSIRGVTGLVGKGLDTLLTRLESSASVEGFATPQREAVLAALNGIIGDRLSADNSPFATRMTLRYRGEVLSGDKPASIDAASGKVLLMMHGLCMNELHWTVQQPGQVFGHAQLLASELGYTPVYLRYNSGLHISQNGRELALRLEQLLSQWPVEVTELTIIAHSMGGLLARSAVHYAGQQALQWPGYLKNMVFLGTPHHGAPLEQAGSWVDHFLRSTPYTAPFARLGQLRSAGITDLRHGYLLDTDWEGHDRFQRRTDDHQPVPLPESVACFSVAATKAGQADATLNRLPGDGLVPVRSALGQHTAAHRRLMFKPASQWIAYGTHHMALLSRSEITQQIKCWLKPKSVGQ